MAIAAAPPASTESSAQLAREADAAILRIRNTESVQRIGRPSAGRRALLDTELDLVRASGMSDEELLAVPGFGQKSLSVFRAYCQGAQ